MMNKNIKIIVAGATGQGKTTIATLIERMLSQLFINAEVSITDDDKPMSDERLQQCVDSFLLSEYVSIDVETKHVLRSNGLEDYKVKVITETVPATYEFSAEKAKAYDEQLRTGVKTECPLCRLYSEGKLKSND